MIRNKRVVNEKIDPADMGDLKKKQMLVIMEKYRTDASYREKINSAQEEDFINMEKEDVITNLEKIALRGMLVASDGSEIINSDMSNYYDDYNVIDLSNDYGVITTCMNMAVANLIHIAFKNSNLEKFSAFNLADIKTRMKGYLFNRKDKAVVIEFIKYYNNCYPNYLVGKAKEFYDMYEGFLKNKQIPNYFERLAVTFNSNIYLYELRGYKNKRRFRK